MTDEEARELGVDSLDGGDIGTYEPPTIQRLGTLAELTQGFGADMPDGLAFGSMI